MGGGVAAEGEGRVQVHLEDVGEGLAGEGLGGVAALDARAVDEDADLVPVCEDGGDEGGYGGRGGEVGRVDCCFAV